MAEELLIKVSADVGGALSGLNQVNGHVEKLGTATSTAGGGLGSLINPMTVAAAGVGLLGAGLLDSIGKAGAFDEKMAGIRATMQPTGAEMDKLKGLALELGKATDVGSVSASDAADAIAILGKAGISADAQLAGVTKSTLQLAAAAGPEFGVAKSAELASDSLNSFGLKAADSTSVVNTLVGAANASSIGLEDLKFALSASGSVAHTVGMNFKDTATAIAVMGSNGLKGSDAGTSLKTMLMNLIPHSKKATQEMMALGLVTKDGSNKFFDAQGHMKSLSDVADVLQTSLKGMSDEQKTAALTTMFGTDAIRGAAILAREGASGIDKMSAAMAQQGDAAKVAADMNNNFKGKMENLGGTIETLQISIGSALTPALGLMADTVNTLVGGFMAWTQSANPLGDVMKVLGDNLPIVAGVATVLGAAVLSALVPALAAGAVAAWAMAAPIIAAAAPFIALGAAVALVVMAFQNNFLGIRDLVVPVVDAVVQALSRFWTEVQPQLITAWNAISSTITTVWNTVVPMIITGVATLKNAWETNWGGIRTIIETVWNIISTTVKTVWAIVSGLIKTGLQVLSGDWSGAWNTIKTTLKTVWDNMGTLLGQAIKLVGTLITDFLPKLVGKLAEWGKAFIDWVGPQIPVLLGKLGELLATVGKWLIDTALPAIVTKLGEWAKAFLDWVNTSVLPFLGGKLAEIASAMWSWIAGVAQEIPGKAAALGHGLIDGIIKGLAGLGQKMADTIRGMVSGAIDDVKKFFGISSPSRYTLQYVGIPLGEGIVMGATQSLQGLTPALNQRIVQSVNAAKQTMTLAMHDLMRFPTMQGDVPGARGGGSNFLGGVTGGGGPGGSGGGGSYMASGVGVPGGVNSDVTIIVKLDSEIISRTLGRRERMRSDG